MTGTHSEKRLIGYARVSTYGQTLDVAAAVVAGIRVRSSGAPLFPIRSRHRTRARWAIAASVTLSEHSVVRGIVCAPAFIFARPRPRTHNAKTRLEGRVCMPDGPGKLSPWQDRASPRS